MVVLKYNKESKIGEENMDTVPFNVYCNSIDIMMGLHDIILNLQKQSPTENIYLGQVTMSPQHAKQFAYLLLEHVKKYEEIFGEIPSPPSEEKMRELSEQGIIGVKSGE
ncbi:hypothetical protein JV16_01811 [Anoxybacillus ayderensis]|nr:hypothetical protein JV16_01811 [Anoxybacillus ayderensis]